MSLRTLYLQSAPTFGGRNGLAGLKLLEEFSNRSSSCLLGYRVLANGAIEDGAGGLAAEILSQEAVADFRPNVIYIEGGLFVDDRGTWKMHWPVVEGLVERGAVLIVADCGTREICRHRAAYSHAARFLRARAEIPTDQAGTGAESSTSQGEDRQIVCHTAGMMVTEWLRPALSGISEIGVGDPARLESWEAIAASRNAQTLGVGRCENGGPVSQQDPWIFASVAQCGFGFVVFIAGEVSADHWIERCPSNCPWLANLCELLFGDSQRNKAREASSIASPFALFLSHRSVNKQLAVRVGEALGDLGAQVWFDAEHPLPVDSLLHETSRGFEKMTHFVVFWSRACLEAPWVGRELPSAVSMAVERRLPVLVVRLDMTPVPEVIGDAFRIEGLGLSPQELAARLIRAVRRIRRNAE